MLHIKRFSTPHWLSLKLKKFCIDNQIPISHEGDSFVYSPQTVIFDFWKTNLINFDQVKKEFGELVYG